MVHRDSGACAEITDELLAAGGAVSARAGADHARISEIVLSRRFMAILVNGDTSALFALPSHCTVYLRVNGIAARFGCF